MKFGWCIQFRHSPGARVCPPPGAGGCSLWLAAFLALAVSIGRSAPGPSEANDPASAPHWSLQPVASVAVPPVRATRQPANPVDAFIRAHLEQAGLSPNPPADKRTLLRRVTFDLTGLPPTLSEIKAFLADRSPNAYERVVDRLLASPRYGERWARHWMDLAHFAETHGNDQDRIRTNAWPYRDYLIRSFNQDKPYARFVEEQLAGDVLYPDDPMATVALGFIAAGPWDESSLRDIREDTLDRQIARYLDRDDMIATTMSTFTSATVHCARCHDHKFDPISQEDYYSLQAVFAGVDRAERVYDLDPAVHARRQRLLRQRRDLSFNDPASIAALSTTAVQQKVARWEKSTAANVPEWTVLEPSSFGTSNGTVLVRQPDNSLLASGPRPEKDVYFVTVTVPFRNATAFRLEVMADPSLPQSGPGRQDNGNLHLSEFEVTVNEPDPGTPARLPWSAASADFDQKGWTSAHALDGQEKTAWGIFPEVGKTHHAIFEIATNFVWKPNQTVVVRLHQLHGGGHLIGRLRLAVTEAARPVRALRLPEDLARIVAVPAARRTASDQLTLARHVLRQQLDQELATLPAPQKVYAAASDFTPDGGLVPAAEPRPIQVLKRGEVTKPTGPAEPGALTALSALPARFSLARPQDEGQRRAALARWVVASQNPLTWRSIVNRTWQHHFGRGLVDSPNDFGRMGSTPSHPLLLDWLATWFREQGGSLKQLHRLLVTSQTYRQSSADRPAYSQRDADNRLLWRMNRSRLEAESIRDAVLQISGDLDFTMYGPSVKHFELSPGVHVTPVVDYTSFQVTAPDHRRRSVYRFLFRTLPDPFMDSLDCPEGSQLTPVRGASVTALQALSMWNNSLIVHQSERFARHLEREHGSLRQQVAAACELVYGRPATSAELRELSEHARHHGLANVCRLLFNSNEFIFVN